VRSTTRTDSSDDEFDPHHSPRSTSFLLGLTLLPLGMPFLWALARVVTKTEPMFSVLVAVAVAVSSTGLGLGITMTRDWSPGRRIKSILALVLAAYAAGGFLYMLKKDWVEVVRKHLGRGELEWREIRAPDQSFEVRMPGSTEPADSPFADWSLQSIRAMVKNPLGLGVDDVFLVAYGQYPAALRSLKEDEWFAKVKALVAPDDGGTLTGEKTIQHQGCNGREYRLVLPDGATNRIVRIYRSKDRAYYLLVEGAGIPMDHADVRKFFDSFYLFKPGK
jgi:hypothetical protein